ncbi:uncharacterized protein BXIN_0482 [Babesia sp. Xinjiang]|uniref:uncharacterized protein n=1 Tax=Babesia sp. Xinjiang TaxID=462227 RepID=UPI000A229F87|nr:uncharacterized protein BXIN_0482 [Babesia sp. Xinjiang]ORM41933.1 hypothetical protein BXIN_0482 [Babesia sp. Xinjiang]
MVISKVDSHLYVGDLYTAHCLFDHVRQPITPDSDSEIEVNEAEYNIKGVITACFDTPDWCNRSDECTYQSPAFSHLVKSPHCDRSYIDLHVDRIKNRPDVKSDSDDSKEHVNSFVLHMVINAEDSSNERLFRAFPFTYDFVEAVHNMEDGNTFIHW